MYKPMKGDIVSCEFENKFLGVNEPKIIEGEIKAQVTTLWITSYMLENHRYGYIWKSKKELTLIERKRI